MERFIRRASSGTLAGHQLWVLVPALLMLCALSQRVFAQGPSVAGTVRYYSNGAPVPDVTVQFNGIPQSSMGTNADGTYAFSDPSAGACSIEPSKTGGTNGAISALDASWILQAVVGLRQFDANQRVICDVTGDGTVSALDAARILQLVAGLRNRLPVADACGSDWVFLPDPATVPFQHVLAPQMSPQCSPGAIVFDSVDAPVSQQDFLAAVFGDCTGNWQAAAAPPGSPTATPPAATATAGVATATPTQPATATRTPTSSSTGTATRTSTWTATATRTPPQTATATGSITPTWTRTPLATGTQTRTRTSTATTTPTFTNTVTFTPLATATQTRTITQWDYIPDDNPAFMKFHLRFKEGLRKAGMPER